MSERLLHLFQETYRELRPRAPLPEIKVEFYVLRAIAHILVAKMYRKPIEREHSTRYRRHISGHDLSRKANLVQQIRGRKQFDSPQGHTYDLDKIFEELNVRFFYGLLARPRLTWSRELARNRLGHYDPAHNAIVISRIFDHPRVPHFVTEYIVYHEMLHLKHPVRLRGSRRCVHSTEFQAEERLFPHLDQAQKFLRRL